MALPLSRAKSDPDEHQYLESLTPNLLIPAKAGIHHRTVRHSTADDGLAEAVCDSPLRGNDEAVYRQIAMTDNISPKPPLTRYIAPAIITAFILIAIVIGLAPRGPKGNFIQSSEFQMAIDGAPMGQPEPLPGRMTVTAINTFRDRQQRYCRTFTLEGAIEGNGIVCRQDGEWLLEGRAAGEEGNRELLAIIERLGGSPLLDIESERQLIAAKWRA